MARPLTKRSPDGVLYARPAAVEEAIDAATALDFASLKARLKIRDRDADGYFMSEVLVHLTRQGRRSGDQALLSAVLPVLLARCEANLIVKIPDGGLLDAATTREDVLGAFSELFAADGAGDGSHELDFFECRFNRAFRTFRIDFIRPEITRAQATLPMPENNDEETPDTYEDSFARISEAFRTPATQESSLSRSALSDAIQALPTDERDAVILVHGLGYKEESDDPDKETAATLCGCTGRTIRNRLTRAAAKLSRFEENV